jgi:hypothetical protein
VSPHRTSYGLHLPVEMGAWYRAVELQRTLGGRSANVERTLGGRSRGCGDNVAGGSPTVTLRRVRGLAKPSQDAEAQPA